MKAKKLVKKLVLNKKTVAGLENGEMNVVKAGGTPWVDNQTIPINQCPSAVC